MSEKSIAKYFVSFTPPIATKTTGRYLDNSWGIEDIRNGFWVDSKYNPTKGEDATFYILPHKISMITKQK